MDRRIFVEERRGEKKGTILFIHGISSSSRVFAQVLQSKKIPHTMISFDLPGHGQSYRSEDEQAYRLDRYKKTIFELLKGHDDVLLVGNSVGGHLALEVARDIQGLRGLVIFGASPVRKPMNLAEAFLPNPAAQYYFSEKVTEEQLDEAMKEAVQNRSVEPVLREDFRNSDPKVRSMLGREISDGTAFSDEAETFVNLHCPRYIFQGEQEPTVNPVYLEKLCAESKGIAEIIRIENCGHYPSLEHPDFFAEKLSEISQKTLA